MALLVAAALAVATTAGLQMPAFFGDNMVLQTRSRGGDRAFLSGWAAPGESVSVHDTNAGPYGQPLHLVTAAEDGSWALQIHAGYYGITSTITVTGSSGGPPAVARNVSFGDAMICAGGDQMAAAGHGPTRLPNNLFVFVVGHGSSDAPPPPGRSDVPAGSVGWLRADDPHGGVSPLSLPCVCRRRPSSLS